ncbi:MAG: DUF308 domain-containing protein [Bacilli bacterium]|nr:DUF308 domain-containing protein [Bacilli bacterium]
MNKESKITLNNLIYSLLFLVIGIMLLNKTEDIITIVSKAIGSVLILIGIIKAIIYIYMKGKIGDYSTSKLVMALMFICLGILFVLFSSTLSFSIRIILGLWVLFSGVNRIIFAISVKSMDKKGFLVYLITALLMSILGVLLVSGVFDQIIGIIIIVYAIMEIVDYIYFKVKNKNYEEVNVNVKSSKKDKKIKRLKKGKVVDAIIEEDK